MSDGYSRNFLQGEDEIQLSRDKIGRAKVPWECIFQDFTESKIQNFGNHGATSKIYWVYYKPIVSSYSKVGTYGLALKNTENSLSTFIFQIFCGGLIIRGYRNNNNEQNVALGMPIC